MHSRLVALVAGLLLLAACGSRPGPAPVISGSPGGPGDMGPAPVGRGESDRITGAPLGPARPGLQQELAAAAGDGVLFAYDRSELSPEGQQTLRRQSEWLRRYPNVTVLIE